MDATALREAVLDHLDRATVLAHAERAGVKKRARKPDLYALLVALVMSGGSDDSGRQADVYETCRAEGAPKVARGSFYAWFTDLLADLLAELLRRPLDDAMEAARERPPLLTGNWPSWA